MNQSEASEYAVCKVVSASSLESETRNGWRIIRVLSRTVYEEIEHNAPGPSSANANYYPMPTVRASAPMPVVVHEFLLGLSEESAIAKLTGEIANLSDHALLLTSQLKHVDKQLENEKAKMEILGEQLKSSEERRQTIREDRDHHMSRAAKLEADLAKVRKAIGDREYTKIVSEAK